LLSAPPHNPLPPPRLLSPLPDSSHLRQLEAPREEGVAHAGVRRKVPLVDEIQHLDPVDDAQLVAGGSGLGAGGDERVARALLGWRLSELGFSSLLQQPVEGVGAAGAASRGWRCG